MVGSARQQLQQSTAPYCTSPLCKNDYDANDDLACSTSSSSVNTLSISSTFPSFPRLPAEIRHEIYAHTIRPRIVRLRSAECACYRSRFSHFWSNSPIPALLHTCPESRRVMQACGYELAFESDTAKPTVWFNFKYDTLYVASLTYPSSYRLSSKDRIRVARLAISHVSENHGQEPEYVRIFGHVKELLMDVRIEERTYFYGTMMQTAFDKDTENDLAGYLECGVSEIMEPARFIRSTGCVVDPEESNLVTRIKDYLNATQGINDRFFERENNRVELQYQKQQQRWSAGFSVPTVKHVYIVTRQQASKILAFRQMIKREREEMEELEHLERVYGLPEAPNFDYELKLLAEGCEVEFDGRQ